MKIVIAPDKFKGCLDAEAVARAIARGLCEVDPSIVIDQCPMADGGEGTVAALVAATGGSFVTRRVTGPLPEMKVDATFGILGSSHDEAADQVVTAVIEMAAASGLALLRKNQYDPLATTTFGTGELIRHAVELGAGRIILGIGGSATTDAGIGAAQACGFTILMRDGEPTSMTEPLCGRDLENVLMVKHGRGEITNRIKITVACDVTNPLYGETGAARVFGPQKGATPSVVQWLDEQLRGLAERTDHVAQALIPGAGAAGGMGFGLHAFFGATLRRGVEIVADAARLRERLSGADLCFTGEGRLDGQSAAGKTAIGVARLCRAANVPCVALAGSIEHLIDDVYEQGITAAFTISDGPMDLEESMAKAADLLSATAGNAYRLFARRASIARPMRMRTD